MRQCYKLHNKIEVGDASIRELEIKQTSEEIRDYQQQLEDDIAQAINDVKYNEAEEMDELTKARCEIINHNHRNYNYDRRESSADGDLLDE
jgi:hypothetical protein